jgi:hypothetical protein
MFALGRDSGPSFAALCQRPLRRTLVRSVLYGACSCCVGNMLGVYASCFYGFCPGRGWAPCLLPCCRGLVSCSGGRGVVPFLISLALDRVCGPGFAALCICLGVGTVQGLELCGACVGWGGVGGGVICIHKLYRE